MRFLTYILAIAAVHVGQTALADDPMPDLDEIVQVRMLSGWSLEDGHHIGALQVTLAPGWKTYWRAAGENGFPPVFHWHGSENISGVEFLWPRPHIITADGIEILGFEHELILPIRFQANAAGRVIHAEGHVDLGICREVCMPVRFPFSTDLLPSDDDTQFLIELALGDRPQLQMDAAPTCRLVPKQDGYRLDAELEIPGHSSGHEIAVVELSQPDIWVSPATVSRLADRVVVTTDLMSFDGKPFQPDLSTFRLTFVDHNTAFEVTGCSLAD